MGIVRREVESKDLARGNVLMASGPENLMNWTIKRMVYEINKAAKNIGKAITVAAMQSERAVRDAIKDAISVASDVVSDVGAEIKRGAAKIGIHW